MGGGWGWEGPRKDLALKAGRGEATARAFLLKVRGGWRGCEVGLEG